MSQAAYDLELKRLLVKPEDAAWMIGVSRAQIYMLIKETSLPTVHLGKSLRIPVRALEQWIDDQVTAQIQPPNEPDTISITE